MAAKIGLGVLVLGRALGPAIASCRMLPDVRKLIEPELDAKLSVVAARSATRFTGGARVAGAGAGVAGVAENAGVVNSSTGNVVESIVGGGVDVFDAGVVFAARASWSQAAHDWRLLHGLQILCPHSGE